MPALRERLRELGEMCGTQGFEALAGSRFEQMQPLAPLRFFTVDYAALEAKHEACRRRLPGLAGAACLSGALCPLMSRLIGLGPPAPQLPYLG